MKIRILFLALLLALPVLATGALYQVKGAQLEKDQPGLKVNVRYPLVSGLGPEVDKAFNAQSKKHTEHMVADFEKRAREMMTEAPDAPGVLAQSLDLDFETKHLSNRLLALLMTGGEFTGGAHPNPIIYSLLVDPKTGAKIEVQDLFVKGAKPWETLSKLSLAELKPRLTDLNTDLKWMTEGSSAKAENFQVVWPGQDGLYVLFTPYQIAPYSSGAPQVVIPYAKLKGLLSDRFFDN